MHGHRHGGPFRMGRRQLLARAGAVAMAGSMGALGMPRGALADHDDDDDDDRERRAKPAPSPIPGTVPVGLPPPLDFIHWFLPGPTTAITPFIGLEGMGLDVEPSMITDYKGFTAFAVLGGQARGSDDKPYNVEFDVRVMEGRYRAEDGSEHRSAFGFF